MPIKEDLIFVGIVSSAQGLQGNVVIKSSTIPASNITTMDVVNELGDKIILKLINQNSQGHLICRFNGVSNRTQAEQLKGRKIFCYKESFPTLNEDEFYIEDLKNLSVLDTNSIEIGKIINICNFGAGDLIEIKFFNSKKTELFPFNKQFFPVITKEHVIFQI